MKMTDDKVLIRRENEKSTGGIYYRDLNVTTGYAVGVVVAVGPGVKKPIKNADGTVDWVNVPVDFKKGDRVLFGHGAIPKITLKIDGKNEDFYTVPAVEVVMVLDPNEGV